MRLKDQLHRSLYFSNPPKRIISLVPSQTELLVDLGLRDNLVGITKFCVHPIDLRDDVVQIGGTKQVDFEKIERLHPDIIICNKEENTADIVAAAEKVAAVYVSDISCIQDCLKMILDMGIIFRVEEKAAILTQEIKSKLEEFESFANSLTPKKVVYLIWKNPLMAAGTDTFINHLLKLNKWENILDCALEIDKSDRYPEIKESFLEQADLILLSSEPFPFKEKFGYELKAKYAKEVLMVDGEYFSWYGSRLANSFTYFKKLHTKF